MIDEQLIPIDIHSSKLVDWLISRRHSSKDWQATALEIRKKINHAIQDMPEDERIVQLLQGAYINYFHCVRIVELLRETEKDTKNFLGYYSSQRMNDWLEIQKMYEKDNVSLAEAAQILQRLVQYEIPGLKKQIAKCDQTVSECSRKEQEYAKQASDCKKQFEKELAAMGIKGDNMRHEIISLAADLPAFLKGVAEEICNLDGPLEYYQNFRNYLHQNNAPASSVLPLCALVKKKGVDVTVYEQKHGVAPARVERPPSLSKEDEEKKDDTIDFGDSADGGEIDFGVTGDEIDFGDTADIQIEVIGDEGGTVDDGVARGLDALSLFEHPETRKLIEHELKELQMFLEFRKMDETSESSSDIYILGMEQRPDNIKNVSVTEIDWWLKQINGILGKLQDPQKAHLLKIRSEPHYVEILVQSLEQKRSFESRYERLHQLMIEKQNEARSAAQKAQSELTQVSEATRILQKQIEEEISKKYKGRTVNIMGGINAALKA